MIRKYLNHTLQATLRHHEEEAQNSNKTQGRQINYSDQPSLLHQDDYKTRKDTKQCTAKHEETRNPIIGATTSNESPTAKPPSKKE